MLPLSTFRGRLRRVFQLLCLNIHNQPTVNQQNLPNLETRGNNMTITLSKALKIAAGVTLGASLSFSAAAQSGALADNYPELHELFNALDVTQGALYDAMAEINADPAFAQERMQTQMHIEEMNNMDMGHGGHGGMDMDMSMDMSGPYGEREVQARVQAANLLRREHSDEDAAGALENAESLPTHAWRVLVWGRQFERNLFDIYADDSTSLAQKRERVAAAIEEYQTGDPRHAVSLTPKDANLYLAHDYASGAKTAFPRLSGLLWTNQWLQLAALEAIVVGQLDNQFAGRAPVTIERYWNKVGSDAGMTMFPVPVEMPSVPAIAPSLYSEAPAAARIIDNLNMLEAAVADIIAYPNLENRDELLEAVASEFTTDEQNVTDEMNYLLSALRGGIFNQGGPAIGELMGSERNRSREAMNMVHTMIMSGPQ